MRPVARGWLWALAIAAFLLLAGSFYLDVPLYRWLRAHQHPAVTAVMEAASRWGDWPSHAIAGVLLAGIAYVKKSRRWFPVFVSIILACAIAGSVTRVVKVATGRSRPSVQLDTGWKGPRFSSKYNSFPSGHTAATVAFFGTLAFARWRLALLLGIIPLTILSSRLYLGAHFLSDVMAAVLIGLVTAFLVWRTVPPALERRAAARAAER